MALTPAEANVLLFSLHALGLVSARIQFITEQFPGNKAVQM